MCSVRHRPMPRAPNPYAISAWSGWSALARMPSRAVPVRPRQQQVEAAEDIRLLGLHLAVDDLQDLARLGRDLPRLDLAGQAVERQPVAFLERRRRRRSASARCSSISSAPAPTTDGLPICRPTTAACDVMPPVAVRMPCATNMPWMSSGTVSLRTSITFLPCARPLHRVIRREHHLAGRRARRGRQAPSSRPAASSSPSGSKIGASNWRQRLGLDHQDGVLRRDELLGHQVGRDDDGRVARCACRSASGACTARRPGS